MFAIDEAKLPPPSPPTAATSEERRVGRAGLHDDRREDRRDQQQHRADDRPVAAAEAGHRERVGQPQHRRRPASAPPPGRTCSAGSMPYSGPMNSTSTDHIVQIEKPMCSERMENHRLRFAIRRAGALPEARVLGLPVVDPAPGEQLIGPEVRQVPSWSRRSLRVVGEFRRGDARKSPLPDRRVLVTRAQSRAHGAGSRGSTWAVRATSEQRADEGRGALEAGEGAVRGVGVLGVQRQPVQQGAQQRLRPLVQVRPPVQQRRRRPRPTPARRRR